MRNELFASFWSRCGQTAWVISVASWMFISPRATLHAQPTTQAQQEEKKESGEEVPKPPQDDFMVEVYKTLDEKKSEKLTFKDKYKQDKTESDVDLIVLYYNWSVAQDDYWNRQLSIDTKNKEGFVIEKIVKSGFGELGFVKPGEKKTQDVFRREKITESGGVATATMVDAEIGAAEKQRFHHLMQKFILKK
jgi:hypothetical protein